MDVFKTCILFGLLLIFCSCGGGKKENIGPIVNKTSNFVKGADISWISEMESTGVKFYNSAGIAMDGIELLKSYGVNAIRLRVWVSPSNGWNSKLDVLAKAIRAKNLGMKIMIDFHYSDTWADPGQQAKPAAWNKMNFAELKQALNIHTKEVLSLLKSNNIDVDWVQVGNETGNGMLWEEGKASENMKNYADLNTEGYDAVKSVYPNAKVIVHIHNGWDNSLFRWIFDGLKSNSSKWDIIGMSLYPNKDNWQTLTTQCIANIEDLVKRYKTEVMICEVGMSWDDGDIAFIWLKELMDKSKAMADSKVLGVFYWEPLVNGGWKGYTLGAFDPQGRPTSALNAFK